MLIFVLIFSFIQFLSPYQFIVVLSDSNSPAQYTGDIILIDTAFDPSTIRVGDILVYKNPNYGITIIHRVYSIWINDQNEIYFAMKGDFNDQPDISNELGKTIINRNVSFSLTTDKVTEPTEIEILVSYYKAVEVVDGKVISQIPFIGWIFVVPFFSPLSFLLILYLLVIIVVGVYTIFKMIYEANNSFKKLLQDMSLYRQIRFVKSKITSVSYLIFLVIPMILFVNIFIYINVHAEYNSNIVVIENNLEAPSPGNRYIRWNETIKLNAGPKSYTNISRITVYPLNESGNFKSFKIDELVSSTGQVTQDEVFGVPENFETIFAYNYQITVRSDTFTLVNITGLLNPSRSLNGHHMFWFTNTPMNPQNGKEGLFVRDFYREAFPTTFEGQEAWLASDEFSGIQELTNFVVNEQAIYSKAGYLLQYDYVQIESLLILPEVIFSLIPIIIFVPTIKLLENKINKDYKARTEILLKEYEEKQSSTDENVSFNQKEEQEII